MALAKSGQCEQAMALAAAIAAAHDTDVNALHRAGAAFAYCGKHEQALDYLHAALRVHPDFHYTELEIGSVHLHLGNIDEALAWYMKARGSSAGITPAHRLAAHTLSRLHRPFEAASLLREVLAEDPTDPQSASELVETLITLNRREDAWPFYDPVIAAGRMRDIDHITRLRLLTEVGRYADVVAYAGTISKPPGSMLEYHTDMWSGHAKLAAAFPRDAVIEVAAAREAGAMWLDTARIVTFLKAAIDERRPASFVRIGDGEARFFAYCDPASRALVSGDEARMLGDIPFQNWFSLHVADAPHADVMMLGAESLAAYQEADILGVPSAARLAVDNAHFGYLAFIESLFASFRTSGIDNCFADSMAHLEIHKTAPFYRDILAGLDFVGVISPHPGLAERLARACGVLAWAEYLIAGESRLPPGALRRDGVPHFPERFRELRHELRVPHRGAVFLVAAGLPGKIYCQWLKRLGAIAIDVGSVVDAWMGFDTRPGQFGALGETQLPH